MLKQSFMKYIRTTFGPVQGGIKNERSESPEQHKVSHQGTHGSSEQLLTRTFHPRHKFLHHMHTNISHPKSRWRSANTQDPQRARPASPRCHRLSPRLLQDRNKNWPESLLCVTHTHTHTHTHTPGLLQFGSFQFFFFHFSLNLIFWGISNLFVSRIVITFWGYWEQGWPWNFLLHLFTFLPRVRWAYRCHSDVRMLNIKLQPEDE